MVAITGTALSLPLHRLPPATRRAPAEQLLLIGQPKPIRVPERRWRSWLDDSEVVARFKAKRYRRADDQCWVWIGAVLDRSRVLPRLQPARTDQVRHRTRAPLRLPTRNRINQRVLQRAVVNCS
jgi:hypothetical protein